MQPKFSNFHKVKYQAISSPFLSKQMISRFYLIISLFVAILQVLLAINDPVISVINVTSLPTPQFRMMLPEFSSLSGNVKVTYGSNYSIDSNSNEFVFSSSSDVNDNGLEFEFLSSDFDENGWDASFIEYSVSTNRIGFNR